MSQTVDATDLIVISDNNRAAYIAAREAEKAIAIELAKSLCGEHGITERIAVANSLCLERTMVEQRQVGYKKGRTLAQRIESWVYKCSLCK